MNSLFWQLVQQARDNTLPYPAPGLKNMTTSRLIIIGAGGLLALVILLIVALALVTQGFRTEDEAFAVSSIGGPVHLVSHTGVSVTEKDFLGKPTLIFFGFTSCPEVCPTTLAQMGAWLSALGDNAEKIGGIYFITVDPARDTVDMLSDYLSSFDPRITGLTGTQEQIAEALLSYRVYAKKVPLEGGDYTMDHTATVYLMDAQGNFATSISYNESPETALAKLKRLIR